MLPASLWKKGLRQVLALDALEKQLGLADKKMSPQLSITLQEVDPRAKFVLLIWNFLSNLAGPANEPDCTQAVRRLLGEAPVANLVIETLKGLGFGDYEAYKAYQAIQWMLVKTDWLAQKELKPSDLMEDWLQDELFKDYLELNEFNQVVWFNKEKFETMLDYMHIAAIIRYASDPQISSVEQAEAVLRAEPLLRSCAKQWRNPNIGSISLLQRWAKPLLPPEHASWSEKKLYRLVDPSCRFALG